MLCLLLINAFKLLNFKAVSKVKNQFQKLPILMHFLSILTDNTFPKYNGTTVAFFCRKADEKDTAQWIRECVPFKQRDNELWNTP